MSIGRKKNSIDLGERGKLSLKNKLNDLTGKEWIKFTKSWFVHRPPRRKMDETLHPAKFPESLVEEFVSFFTKKGQWILDPFLGTGSSLISAGKLERNGVGFEISKKYFDIALRRINRCNFENEIHLINSSSSELNRSLGENKLPNILFDYTITSPPYWNQLKRNSMRQKNRRESGLDTKYSEDARDLGNIDDYREFLSELLSVFDQVYERTKTGGYLTIITNNIYFNGRLFPLAYDTAVGLTQRGKRSWILKDEKIWLQDDKPLIALGVNNAYVGNRHHQYCLIFRKESD